MKLKTRHELYGKLHLIIKVLYDLKNEFFLSEGGRVLFEMLLNHTARTFYEHRFKDHEDADSDGATAFSISFNQFFSSLANKLHQQEAELPAHLAARQQQETTCFAINSFLERHYQTWELKH